MRRNTDGIGTSGLCISQLSFDVPGELYAARAAKTVVKGVSGLPTYYIDSRTKSKGVVSVTCLDRLAFADIDFPLSKIDSSRYYSLKALEEGKKSDYSSKKITKAEYTAYLNQLTAAEKDFENIPITSVVQLIVNEAGFSGISGIPSWITTIKREKLECSCSEILSFIAECCCGFFYMTDNDVCTFVPYGSYSSSMAVKSHTALDIGIDYTANGILCTDGKGVQYSRGGVGFPYDTLQINSDLITNNGCEEIWNRARGKTVTQFKCDKAIVSSVPYPAELIKFAQGYNLIAHSISCKITACGIIASLSGNAPSDGEIGSRHRLTRNKVELGKRSGNVMHTKYQGLIILDDEE